MVVTIGSAYRHALHAVDQEAFSEGVTLQEIINRAGMYMLGMRSWTFQHRQDAKLQIVQDQAYVELPADFEELIAEDVTESLVQSLRPTSSSDLLHRRTNRIQYSTWDYWYVISWKVPATSDDDEDLEDDQEPFPIMELWPTPVADDPEGFTIAYKARWPWYYGSETRRIAIPDYMEALYLHLVRTFAKAYEEEADGDLAARLEGLMDSQLFRTAAQADSRRVRDFGPIRKSAVELAWQYHQHRYNYGLVADPS